MLGRRGRVDPGRHPVRAAPEAVENRLRVRQEQKLGRFPKWNVSCRCRMPGASRTPVKIKRRAAARNLLRSPDATPRQKRHLAFGVSYRPTTATLRVSIEWIPEQIRYSTLR